MEKKYIKVLKRMLIAIFFIVSIFIIGALGIVKYVQVTGERSIAKIESLPQDVDAIIVLGAGVKSDGSPSDILADRLQTTIDIYEDGVNGKILLSGDHGKEGYNEVGTMKKYIEDRVEVDSKDIFLDHAGFSTYDSIYRAKEIFKVNRAVIVTNEYHLPRALYIAKKLGIDAYGVVSDKREYYYMSTYTKREKLAQLKDFLYVNVIKPEPKYLGDEIPVSTSDGRITHDEV